MPTIGIYGVGTNVPGTTEAYLNDTTVAAFPAGTNLRLHAMTVSVQAGVGAQDAKGWLYLGTMPGNVARTGFLTWNQIAGTVITRREARTYSAYETLAHPAVKSTAPSDVTQWSSFDRLALDSPSGLTYQLDTTLPIVLVLLPTAATVDYLVTVNCEWRVLFPLTDMRSSLHEEQKSASSKDVTDSIQLVVDASGDVIESGPVSGVMPGRNALLSGAGLGLVAAGLYAARPRRRRR
jgi:hypothetical protein